MNYRDSIKSLIQRHGRQIIDDPQRFESLLLDNFSETWRETKLILFGLHVDIAWELRDSPEMVVSKHSVERLRQKLYDEYGIDRALAYWVIEEWASVFDKTVELPSPARTFKAASSNGARRFRGHFQVAFWTAFVTAGVIVGAFRLWGDDPQRDPLADTVHIQETSESKNVQASAASENSRQVTAEISVSVGKQTQSSLENPIQENSRFTLTVRDAMTDEKYQLFIHSKDEEAFEEPKDWRWGKKGDPIYKGKYDFYLQKNGGSLTYEFRHDEYRFNMNHNMAFTSEANDSVIIVTQYSMTGGRSHYLMYQLLEGKMNYVGSDFGDRFSEDMVPDDLIQ